MFSPIRPAETAKARRAQFLVQFGVDQVNLTQIRLGRVARHP
jgi:hypothetical protein